MQRFRKKGKNGISLLVLLEIPISLLPSFLFLCHGKIIQIRSASFGNNTDCVKENINIAIYAKKWTPNDALSRVVNTL